MKNTICDKCNKEISNCNYKKHNEKCNGKGPYCVTEKCNHCGASWEELGCKRNEKGNHTRWCLANPKLKQYKESLKTGSHFLAMKEAKIKKYGQESWNSGLTKDNSEKIRIQGERLSVKYKTGELVCQHKDKPLSKKHKENISNGMKRAHAEGRHPGYSFINKDPSRMSYPERFIKALFENANLFEQYEIEVHKSVGKYFLDFSFSDLKIDFEVDSQYHIKSEEAISHDRERNRFLIDNGWFVYRVFWKDFMKDPEKGLRAFINYLNIKEKPKLVTFN